MALGRSVLLNKMVTAYWCLGSNLEPQKNIRLALHQFQEDFSASTVSKIYRSAAVGFDGGDFLNVVLATQTSMSPPELLNYARQLEDSAGRVRIERGRFDSRTLDVDLLMVGQLQGEHHGRQWPNPDIVDYAHVLKPLSEIAGSLIHPLLEKPLAQLWIEFEQVDQMSLVVEELDD